MADTSTTTYTGDMSAMEKLISDKGAALASGKAGLPGVTEALRKSLYSREQVLPGLEGEAQNKMTELFRADQDLQGRYGDPNSPMYIENPSARQGAVSGYKADIRGQYGDVFNMINSRSRVLGNALDKGIQLYQAGLAAQEAELGLAESSWERAMKKEQLKIQQSQEDRAKKEFDYKLKSGTLGTATEQKAMAVQNLKKDVAGYMELKPLLSKYANTGGLTPDEILAEYNAFHSQKGSPWGPATETTAQLSALGITPNIYTRQQEAAKTKTDTEMKSYVDTQISSFDTEAAKIQYGIGTYKDLSDEDRQKLLTQKSNDLRTSIMLWDKAGHTGAWDYFKTRKGITEALPSAAPSTAQTPKKSILEYILGGQAGKELMKPTPEKTRVASSVLPFGGMLNLLTQPTIGGESPAGTALPTTSVGSASAAGNDVSTLLSEAQSTIQKARASGADVEAVKRNIVSEYPELIGLIESL